MTFTDETNGAAAAFDATCPLCAQPFQYRYADDRLVRADDDLARWKRSVLMEFALDFDRHLRYDHPFA